MENRHSGCDTPTVKTPVTCRLCIAVDGEYYFSLFVSNEVRKISVENAIRNLLDLEVYEGDGLPETVCIKCFGKLLEFSEFKDMCMKSAADLRACTVDDNCKRVVKKEVLACEYPIEEGSSDWNKYAKDVAQASELSNEAVDPLALVNVAMDTTPGTYVKFCSPAKEGSLSYVDLSEKIRKCLQDCSDGSDSGSVITEIDVSDSDDEEYSEHNTDSSIELDSEDDGGPCSSNAGDRSGSVYRGRNGYLWNKNEPKTASVGTPGKNIVVQQSELKAPALILGENPFVNEVFDLIFDESMFYEILKNTNVRLDVVRNQLGEKSCPEYSKVDHAEMKALIGLLLLSSSFECNRGSNNRSFFWSRLAGLPDFHSVMSKKRFEALTQCLCFDDPRTRADRRKTDPTAAISGILGRFVENSQKCFSVGAEVCVDEMLVPFRGRCPFKMFMPKKPAKYGIKVMCLVDVQSNYLFDAYVHSGGKDPDGVRLSEIGRRLGKPTQSVLRLCRSILGTGKNVTGDSWFSSVELVEELRERGLTYVGTLKKNVREVPRQFVSKKGRVVGSSLYGFANKKTLLSYVPKKDKAVLLLSSLHQAVNQGDGNIFPEIISFHNRTKGGVDTLGKKCSDCSRVLRTGRWPLAIFLRLLNMMCVNAFVLYVHFKGTPPMKRVDFVEQLCMRLIEPHSRRCFTNSSVGGKSFTTHVDELTRVRERESPIVVETGDGRKWEDKMEKRRTCYSCDSKLKRKTQYKCVRCDRPVCLECGKKVCVQCLRRRDR